MLREGPGRPPYRKRELPLSVRWARFGPNDRRWLMHVPVGGVCLSAFVLVRNPNGDVLLGRPRPHRAWADKGCLPPFRVKSLVERNEWILPASHLKVEERPDDAARRICRDWAGLRGARPRMVAVDSSRMATGRWTGSGPTRRPVHHWAVGFVYEVASDRPPPTAPWWSETAFVPMSRLLSTRIGRAHRDFLRYATREWPPKGPRDRPLAGR
jgi:ADP-ribose pyrophosphatase YjhB (NUDIX family)